MQQQFKHIVTEEQGEVIISGMLQSRREWDGGESVYSTDNMGSHREPQISGLAC